MAEVCGDATGPCSHLGSLGSRRSRDLARAAGSVWCVESCCDYSMFLSSIYPTRLGVGWLLHELYTWEIDLANACTKASKGFVAPYLCCQTLICLCGILGTFASRTSVLISPISRTSVPISPISVCQRLSVLTCSMAPVKSGNSWKNLLLLSSGNERLLDEEDIDFGSDVYALAESPWAWNWGKFDSVGR